MLRLNICVGSRYTLSHYSGARRSRIGQHLLCFINSGTYCSAQRNNVALNTGWASKYSRQKSAYSTLNLMMMVTIVGQLIGLV